MGFFELCLLALGVSVDVAVISVGAGALARLTVRKAFVVAVVLALFHAGMTILGWWLGSAFSGAASSYGNVIGALLMFLVGLKMLKDAVTPEDTARERDILLFPSLLLLSFAASIDAFVIGITFTFITVSITEAVVIIGAITFVVSIIGTYLGRKSRHLLGPRVQVLGALLVMLLAVKVLLF